MSKTVSKNAVSKNDAAPTQDDLVPTAEKIVPVLGEDVWETMKAWVRRELQLHAAGVSHDDRQANNP